METAFVIFQNIDAPEISDEMKGVAILKIMGAATHNSITKDDMLRVIRWLWDMVFEESAVD